MYVIYRIENFYNPFLNEIYGLNSKFFSNVVTSAHVTGTLLDCIGPGFICASKLKLFTSPY